MTITFRLDIPRFETAGETVKKPALHIAITKYLEQIEALKKPNTHRKYEAVLNRFGGVLPRLRLDRRDLR